MATHGIERIVYTQLLTAARAAPGLTTIAATPQRDVDPDDVAADEPATLPVGRTDVPPGS